MSTATITVLGLGPGRWDDLTLAARAVLESAPLVICRTTRHPTVDALREHRPDLTIESFDALYDGAQSFATLYAAIAERLVTRAQTLAFDTDAAVFGIVYAVPGHPLIG